MDIKRISPYPDHCTVTLDIPWDVAEALVSAGPSLISKLRDVVTQHKQRVDKNEELNRLRNKDADSPLQEWQAMADVADQRIRQLISDEDLSFAQAISKTAKEHQFSPSSMRALIESYRKSHKEEVAKSRDIEIIRLYFKGVSNRIIADHLNTNTRTVQRCLAEHKDIIRFARNQIVTEASEPKRETRKEQKERYLRRNAEILEQHSKGVTPHRLTKIFKLNIGTIQGILKTCATTTSALNRDQEIQERKEKHRKIGVQLYRQYRGINPPSREIHSVYRDLAEQFSGVYGGENGLPPFYAEHLTQARRNKVKAYVKNRRLNTIIRLKAEKYTNSDIAQIVCLHEKSVARIFRDHKASLIQGEAS